MYLQFKQTQASYLREYLCAFSCTSILGVSWRGSKLHQVISAFSTDHWIPAGKNPPLCSTVLPPPLFLSLSLCLSSPFFSFTQHSQQYLSEQGHALEQRLQQSQQVTETVYVPVSLVSCNNCIQMLCVESLKWGNTNTSWHISVHQT